MNSTLAIVGMIVWAAIGVSLTVFVPSLLSDQNEFLDGFVNHEFLSFMGVLVTITLASSANLFVELNKLEERHDGVSFAVSKAHVKDSAYALVGALVVSLCLVVIKPWVGFGRHGESFVNCVALGTIGFSIMILIDLTQAAFALDPQGLKAKKEE